ncbi:MAG: TIGR04282 family arsenosugar biosynthesis glycosyltransferase [Alphaproteobacteria bacterium]
MKKTLVIFARAPRLGRGKRRLAAGLGSVAAWRFQCWALDRVIRRLSGDRRWRCVIAETGGPARWPANLRRITQTGGDLGRRMHHAMRGHETGPVVLVGTDVPDIAPHHIADAFSALGRNDAVFGPAADGGYWLVGLRRPASTKVFTGIRWSTGHTLADSLDRLGQRQRHHLLETLPDIDDAGSLHRWRVDRKPHSRRN